MTAIFIVAIVALVVIVIILAVMYYHQMLLLNEMNKRLLLLHEESIEKERNTMDALNQKLQDEAAAVSEKFDGNGTPTTIPDDHSYNNGFDPFNELDSMEANIQE